MKRILISAFTLLLATTSFAQVDRSKMPEPGPAPKIELGQTKSFTLDNGLKVFVVENHKLPRVAYSLQLNIEGVKEGDKAGTAEIAGNLMKTATKNRTKEEIDFGIDFIGARLSTSAMSVYGTSLVKHQDELLSIMSDVVKNAKFSEEELEKLKKQYKSNIKSQQNEPDAISSNVRRVLLYGKDHPYGEVMTEETIDNISLEDAEAYYKTYFRPNISYLAVVGDINLKQAKALVKKYFGDWKKGEIPSQDFKTPKQPQITEVAFVNNPGAVQSVISVFNTIELQPGSEDVIPASIANGILGGGFTSKLNLNLREENAYTYGAGSSISSDKLVGNFYASAKVRNDVTDSALTETLKELMNMRKGEVTADELQTIKNYRTGTFAYSLENPQTKARFAINIDKNNLPADYYETYLEKLAAVTLEDVKAVSNKYINPMNGFILVVGNKEEIAERLKKFSPTGKINYYDAYGNEATETKLKNAPEGVTAKSVVEKYIEAIGGEKNLKKVKSIKEKMSTTMQGMAIDIVIYNGENGEYLSVIESNGMMLQKQVYDGTKGKVSGAGGSQMLGEEDLDKMKYESLIFPELYYGDEGYKIELKGVDTKNGKDAYVVEVEKPNGDKQTNYYDVESNYLIFSTALLETPKGNFTQENTYSDYKKDGNVMFSYSRKEATSPQEMDLKIEKIEINPTIDKDLFKVEED